MTTKHGHTTKHTQSPTYATYQNMISRCHRPNHPKYPSYGGKGIFVCDRWRESFENFLEDMGGRPEKTTIDRIDGAKGYEAANCRWATIAQQQSNISTNINLTFNGKTQNVSTWAAEIGIDKSLLAWRMRNGWDVEKALTTKPMLGNRTKKTGQVLYEFGGKTQCVSEWSREFGISNSLLRLRLERGWGIEKALKEPKGKFVKKGDHLSHPF